MSEKGQAELTITITGGFRTGKTALAVAIHDLLREAGFGRVDLRDPDSAMFPTPSNQESARRLRAVSARCVPVRIITAVR
jgi:thymidylate kinase